MKTWRMVCSLLATLAVAGCAATPQVSGWRPWYKVLGDGTQLAKPGEKLHVRVTGTIEPLLGDETLFRSTRSLGKRTPAEAVAEARGTVSQGSGAIAIVGPGASYEVGFERTAAVIIEDRGELTLRWVCWV